MLGERRKGEETLPLSSAARSLERGNLPRPTGGKKPAPRPWFYLGPGREERTKSSIRSGLRGKKEVRPRVAPAKKGRKEGGLSPFALREKKTPVLPS